MSESLAAALALHQAGQFEQAAKLYEQILATDRDSVAALHLLGVLHHQRGDHAEAVRLIGRAVALRPSVPAFHANLAEAYRALGQFDRAVGCCRIALRLAPDFPEALANLGLALHAQGKATEAEAQLRRALAVRPDFAAAHNNLGLILRKTDRSAEALACFRRAVECDTAFAAARTNLGQMLVELGATAEALHHCQQAARLTPDVAAAHNNLGNALAQANRLVEARAAYLEAIRLAPLQASAYIQLGRTLHREGQPAQAVAWLKQAAELEPTNATYWAELAEVHDELEEFAASIPCWQQVLRLEPNRAVAHVALGWAWQEQGQPANAERCYRDALHVQPDLGRAILFLGGLHEERGDVPAAEAAYREALRVAPDFALPHSRLAMLLRGRLPADDQRALERRLTDPELVPFFRARLLFALGHVLDIRGEFRRAAECLTQANELTFDLIPVDRRYSPGEHQQFVDNLLRFTGHPFFARNAGGASLSDRPVFIVGLPRSGTTLIEQILARHTQVHAAGELRLARRTFEAIPRVAGRTISPVEAIEHLDLIGARRLAEDHLQQLNALAPAAASRIVDKMPDNYVYLGLLAVLFPRATFIHVRRDLRDVALSCWMTDFRSIRWAHRFDDIASRFQQYARLMDHWRGVLPVTLHKFDYEDVVADLETNARRLVAACGLEWEPACLTPHEARRQVRTASVAQVREPVYQRSVGRWRNYVDALAELFARLPPSSYG